MTMIREEYFLPTKMAMAISLGTIPFILFIFTLFFISKFLRTRNLPPGPRPWPILGNLPQIARSQFPHKIMMQLTKIHGPIIFLQLGAVPTIVVDSPCIARDILMKQDHLFASRPQSIACQHFTYNGSDIAFAPYGPHWRAMRKIASLKLLSPRKLAGFRRDRSTEFDELVQSVLADSKISSLAISLRDKFATLSCSNLTRMLLGKRYFGPEGAGPRDAAEHKQMIYDGFALVNAFNVADYLPFLRWMDLQGQERAMRAIMKRTDEVYDQIIREHRSKRRISSDDEDDEGDFFDVLINEGLSDTTVKAIVVDMLSAGTDTSSVTSEWAMAELIRHPEELQKVRDEIDSIVGKDRKVEESDLPKLRCLKAAVKETFRLHPVGAFLIPHFSTEDARVAGYEIPKGTRILINNYSLGRSEATWGSDAHEFKPSRFLDDEHLELADSECRIVPFGAGRRSCPGAALGGCMVLMGIARLIHSFDWVPPNGIKPREIDVSELEGFTVLKNPLQLVATARLAPRLYAVDD